MDALGIESSEWASWAPVMRGPREYMTMHNHEKMINEYMGRRTDGFARINMYKPTTVMHSIHSLLNWEYLDHLIPSAKRSTLMKEMDT